MIGDRYDVQRLTEQGFLIGESESSDEKKGPNNRILR